MGKVTLSDTLQSSIVKMCEGNPGGLSVLLMLVEQTTTIDPAAGLGGLHYILMLDDLGIYGSHIWMLYKDVCGQQVEGVIALLRGHQLGHLRQSELREIIEKDKPYDVTPLIAKIREDVPDFAQGF